MRVVVEVEVRPTESEEKVKKAVLSILKPSSINVEEIYDGFKLIRAECNSEECLEPLRDMAKRQQVEPALRNYLNKYKHGNKITLLLHKQAAYVGKLSLIDSESESPLGPIKLEIECPNEEELEKIVEFLTG